MRAFLAAETLAALTLGCNPPEQQATASEPNSAKEDSVAAAVGIDSLLADTTGLPTPLRIVNVAPAE